MILIDSEDCWLLDDYNYYLDKDGYIVLNIKTESGKWVFKKLHRLITDCPQGLVVDHIDHNKLNNQKSNLRICTKQENSWNNKSKNRKKALKYKGYSLEKGCKRYRARIIFNKKEVPLGYFETEEEAAIAYNKKALELFGEFARLNIIDK